MTTMISEVYTAFRSTGVSDELAREAAEAMAAAATGGPRFDKIEATLAQHSATLAQHSATLAQHSITLAQHSTTLAHNSTTLALHTWMIGGLYAILVAGGAPLLWLGVKMAFKIGVLT